MLLSAPPRDGGFPTWAQGSHLARDTGVGGIYSHPSSQGSGLSSKCQPQGLGHTRPGYMPLAWGRRLAQPLLGKPRMESEQGVLGWELLQGWACAQFTLGPRALPPGLAQCSPQSIFADPK